MGDQEMEAVSDEAPATVPWVVQKDSGQSGALH